MTPRQLRTRPADRAEARGRLAVAQKYLEVAELVSEEPGAGANVCVGVAVLAAIAASDAVCIGATGERYSGTDHAAAATLLERVDRELGRALKRVVDVKNESHYGSGLIGEADRTMALRNARHLVEEARQRLRP
ncbi:hypothetical protein [Demequina sp. NBRC 110056]|uniref:hypothetical protein n=1 Tax=Demequina sp. NBRC 110056 TaxID=1570345 RepID=UPI000A074578|nr:hypothetical protein [Demequina sp. NBRC 110056]